MKAGKLSFITGKIPGFVFTAIEKAISEIINTGLDLHMKLLDTFPDRYNAIKKEYLDNDDANIPYADELQECPPPTETPVNPGYPNTFIETEEAKNLREYRPTWQDEPPTVPDKPLKGSYAERMLRK